MKLKQSLAALIVTGLITTSPANLAADLSLNVGGGFLLDISNRIHGENQPFFNFYYNKEKSDIYTLNSEKADYVSYGIGANYNVSVVNNLDMFAGVGIGFAQHTSSNYKSDETNSGLTYQIGATLKLTDNVAVNARYLNRPENGLSGLEQDGGSAASAGVSFLF
ncbi:outer membrane beta-barrel protein [Thiomicrospira pelophila]|uniref:outer membrane beta-barrel protein n=1 Tax=Thiomicrospira pelophila TaxID=934 RepID=UPI0004A702E5|nr:outer membrane beta-barrel protein [Thiomicrospira pelophila]